MSGASSPPAGFEVNQPPPGFELNARLKPGRQPQKPEMIAPTSPMVASGQVADGDTFRLQSGTNARLYGADAFEMDQNAMIGSRAMP